MYRYVSFFLQVLFHEGALLTLHSFYPCKWAQTLAPLAVIFGLHDSAVQSAFYFFWTWISVHISRHEDSVCFPFLALAFWCTILGGGFFPPRVWFFSASGPRHLYRSEYFVDIPWWSSFSVRFGTRFWSSLRLRQDISRLSFWFSSGSCSSWRMVLVFSLVQAGRYIGSSLAVYFFCHAAGLLALSFVLLQSCGYSMLHAQFWVLYRSDCFWISDRISGIDYVILGCAYLGVSLLLRVQSYFRFRRVFTAGFSLPVLISIHADILDIQFFGFRSGLRDQHTPCMFALFPELLYYWLYQSHVFRALLFCLAFHALSFCRAASVFAVAPFIVVVLYVSSV